jgi:hypothetical protein
MSAAGSCRLADGFPTGGERIMECDGLPLLIGEALSFACRM